MIRAVVIILFVFMSSFTFAQNKAIIQFIPRFHQEVMNLDTSNFLFTNYHGINIDVLKFYISNILFYNQGNIVFEESSSYHLVDETNSLKTSIELQIPKDLKYDQLQFVLGIDSVTNNSGALEGDLDPTKGMYWTWQSGYINFKLEGSTTTKANKKASFEYHLGGYRYPYASAQTLSYMTNGAKTIRIAFELDKFLEGSNQLNSSKVMSPGPEALTLSQLAGSCFTLLHD